MQFQAYGFQLLPGSDDSLHFAKTYEECRDEATELRREYKALNPGAPPLGPMKVYQFFMRMPEEADLLNAFNRPDETAEMLLKHCIIERREVGEFSGE